MSSNPGRVELGVRGTSVLSRTWTKYINLLVEFTGVSHCFMDVASGVEEN